MKSLKPTGLWPQDALYFKTFPKDDAYTLLHQILIQRGWKFAGEPYKGNDPAALSKVIKRPQPRYGDLKKSFLDQKTLFGKKKIIFAQKSHFLDTKNHFWTKKSFLDKKVILGQKSHVLTKKIHSWTKKYFLDKKVILGQKNSFLGQKKSFSDKKSFFVEFLDIKKLIFGQKIILDNKIINCEIRMIIIRNLSI